MEHSLTADNFLQTCGKSILSERQFGNCPIVTILAHIKLLAGLELHGLIAARSVKEKRELTSVNAE